MAGEYVPLYLVRFFRMVFSYLVTKGWILTSAYVIIPSINQSVMDQHCNSINHKDSPNYCIQYHVLVLLTVHYMYYLP